MLIEKFSQYGGFVLKDQGYFRDFFYFLFSRVMSRLYFESKAKKARDKREKVFEFHVPITFLNNVPSSVLQKSQQIFKEEHSFSSGFVNGVVLAMSCSLATIALGMKAKNKWSFVTLMHNLKKLGISWPTKPKYDEVTIRFRLVDMQEGIYVVHFLFHGERIREMENKMYERLQQTPYACSAGYRALERAGIRFYVPLKEGQSYFVLEHFAHWINTLNASFLKVVPVRNSEDTQESSDSVSVELRPVTQLCAREVINALREQSGEKEALLDLHSFSEKVCKNEENPCSSDHRAHLYIYLSQAHSIEVLNSSLCVGMKVLGDRLTIPSKEEVRQQFLYPSVQNLIRAASPQELVVEIGIADMFFNDLDASALACPIHQYYVLQRAHHLYEQLVALYQQ